MTTERRKRVSVSFAGDDDVVQHIVPLKTRTMSLRVKLGKRAKRVNYVYESDSEEMDEEDDDDRRREEDETYVRQPSSSSLALNGELTGGDVYRFRTPTKTNQLARTVAAVVSEKRATQEMTSDPESENISTPKSKRRAEPSTPVGQRQLRTRGKKVAASTPFRLRERNKDLQSSSSSEEESVASSDDDEDDSGMDEVAAKRPRTPTTPLRRPKTAQHTPKRTTALKTIREEDDCVKAESVQSYFAQDGGMTSDRTLARLALPQLDGATLRSALADHPAAYGPQRELLARTHRAQFRRWMYQLCNGYNLLFHGLGSKRTLLEEFRVEMLSDFTHIVVNGYFPSLTLKSVLNAITEDILEHLGTFRSAVDQCEFIRKEYECGDYSDLYVMIHNIDAPMLRGRKLQDAISSLAQVRGVHLVASIDHINAPLIWDGTHAARYNWLWHDATTFAPYAAETSYENSLLVDRQGAPLALSALTHVLRSLTANARGIFRLLVARQLDAADGATYQGLSRPELYRKCREAFLVNSDLTLTAQLTEFRDHKLIRSRKGVDGVEYLLIPLDESTLKEFVDQQDE